MKHHLCRMLPSKIQPLCGCHLYGKFPHDSCLRNKNKIGYRHVDVYTVLSNLKFAYVQGISPLSYKYQITTNLINLSLYYKPYISPV